MNVLHGVNERLQAQLLLLPLTAAANPALMMRLHKSKTKDTERLDYKKADYLIKSDQIMKDKGAFSLAVLPIINKHMECYTKVANTENCLRY